MASPSNVTFFKPALPVMVRIEMLYDPDTNPTGTTIAPIGSIVIDLANEGIMWLVSDVDPDTFKPTLIPTKQAVIRDDPSLTSVRSYGNDIFRLFYDTRTTPVTLTPDERCEVHDGEPLKYRLIRYPNTDHEKVVSKYYDATGTYVGDLIPFMQVSPDTNTWTPTNCHTTEALTAGERLRMEVFNPNGAEVARIVLHAKPATIVNSNLSTTVSIVDMTLDATQLRSNGELYIFEKQSVASLNIVPRLHFSDGRTIPYPIDNQKCFLYGLEDFEPSFSGLQQEITVKYFLDPTENATNVLTAGTAQISKSIKLTVVPNELLGGIKVSVIPVWNPGTNSYGLRYRYYTTDRKVSRDITLQTTITTGTFNGALYGVSQQFTITVDLNKVDPVLYPDTIYHRQIVVIKLNPSVSYERYTLRDSMSSFWVYGIDHTTQRRPAIQYDTTARQYFVPTSIFANKEAFLKSFYYAATPPYLSNIGAETAPVEPSHFVVRDVVNGTALVADPIDINQYGSNWSLLNTTIPNRLVGGTVVVDFIKKINATDTLILYGVPVDVYP